MDKWNGSGKGAGVWRGGFLGAGTSVFGVPVAKEQRQAHSRTSSSLILSLSSRRRPKVNGWVSPCQSSCSVDPIGFLVPTDNLRVSHQLLYPL